MLFSSDPRSLFKLPLVCLVLILQACSNQGEKISVADPQALYAEALVDIEKEYFGNAAKKFAAIEREYPISELSYKSNIMRGYALYRNGDFVDSIFAAEDFIKLYPDHPHTDYMYYLKAICQYDQIVDVERDQKQTLDAMEDLDVLIAKYPNSIYAADAKNKRLYAYNAIAGKEMAIGNLYLSNKKFISALPRYKNVVRNYSRSIFIEEALYRLVELYYVMGVTKDAVMYAAILGHNYPASHWYSKSYKLLKKHG